MSTRRGRQDEERTEPPTPDPDDPRKPEDPTDLTKRSWFYVLRKTMHEFSEDQCTDLAAALTYYAVLAIFPAMLALISVLGVIGQAPKAVEDRHRHPASRWSPDDHADRSSSALEPVATHTAPASRWSSASWPPSGRPPGTSAPSAGR